MIDLKRRFFNSIQISPNHRAQYNYGHPSGLKNKVISAPVETGCPTPQRWLTWLPPSEAKPRKHAVYQLILGTVWPEDFSLILFKGVALQIADVVMGFSPLPSMAPLLGGGLETLSLAFR